MTTHPYGRAGDGTNHGQYGVPIEDEEASLAAWHADTTPTTIVTLTVRLEGADLGDLDLWAMHLSELLARQAHQVDEQFFSDPPAELHDRPVLDVNGNTVGRWAVITDPGPATDSVPAWKADRMADVDNDTPVLAPQVEASGWSLWLGAPEAAPWADLLDSLPTLFTGGGSDLKVDRGGVRVWLSRMTVGDGEPFARTLHVERWSADPAHATTAGWLDAGHFDGDEPEPNPTDFVLKKAHDLTCDMIWEASN
jgi:hypothetical protein